MKIKARIAVVATLLCGLSCAFFRPSISVAGVGGDEAVDKYGHKRYSVEGSSYAAELVGTWAPNSYWQGAFGEPDAECPITLGDRFPYPNPYSVPVLALTVFESSDLKLEVLGSEGRVVDAFLFEKVEQGAYVFKAEQLIWTDNEASLRLTFGSDCVKVVAVPRTIIVGVK